MIRFLICSSDMMLSDVRISHVDAPALLCGAGEYIAAEADVTITELLFEETSLTRLGSRKEGIDCSGGRVLTSSIGQFYAKVEACQPSMTLFSIGSTVTPLLRRKSMAPLTSASLPLSSTAMMPIACCTLAWRMSKTTSGNLRLICQMIGCSTCTAVGNVNQQRRE